MYAIRSYYGVLFRQVHERRVNLDLAFHAEPQCLLQCLDRRFATIRITTVVRLRDAGDEVADAALVGIRGRERQEDEVAARHELHCVP